MRTISAAVLLIAIAGCNNGSGPSSSPQIYGWAVGDNTGNTPTIVHTTDGLQWTPQGTDLVLPGATLGSVCVVDSSTAWAAGGISEGFGVVLKTTDGGETWLRMGTEIGLPEATSNISALNEHIAWVGGSSGGVYYTSDGGITWADRSNGSMPDAMWQGVDAISSSNVWISGILDEQGFIRHSADGGVLWTAHAESLVNDWPVLSIEAYDQNTIWAVGHGFRIYRSFNGGADWELAVPDSLGQSPNDANELVVLSPLEVWVALDYGNIWKTTDGGLNWDVQQVPSDIAGYFMLGIDALDTQRGWAVGAISYPVPNGAIITTSDGGATWERVDDGTLTTMWDIHVIEQ